MLVLSRGKNEAIMIGDDIEIVVVEIKGDRIRLGINAPREVSIHRKEVYEAIQKENIKAAGVDLGQLDALEDLLQQRPRKDKEEK